MTFVIFAPRRLESGILGDFEKAFGSFEIDLIYVYGVEDVVKP